MHFSLRHPNYFSSSTEFGLRGVYCNGIFSTKPPAFFSLFSHLVTGRVGGLVSRFSFHQVGHGTKSEPVRTLVQPELQNGVQFLQHLGVFQIQFGLFLEERVVVMLLASCVPFPGRSLGVLAQLWIN